MCWNAEVSLNTFIFGLISMIIVLILNKISYKIILFTLTLTLIQLLEYYTWNNINNKETVYYLSIIGFFIISFQIALLNYWFLNKNDKPIALLLLFILLIHLFIHNYQNNKFRMEKGENKHLIWHWVDIPLPLLIIILTFYIYPSFRYGYIAFIYMIIPLSISLYNYYKYKTWGSMWCYISNIIWIRSILKSLYETFNGKKEIRQLKFF